MLELLNLNVGGEHYSLNIQSVREIRVLSGLRSLPDAPDGWLGVIDFRDTMVPIIDLRKVFAASDSSINEKTVVVVVQVDVAEGKSVVGLVADEVSDVIQVESDELNPPPSGFSKSNAVITGLFKHEGKIMVLLDSNKLVSTIDFSSIRNQLASVDKGGLG